MRIFFLSSNVPQRPHDTRAPSVLIHEAIGQFVEAGHEVVLQLILPEEERVLTAEETPRLRGLEATVGLSLLPPLWATDIVRCGGTEKRGRWDFSRKNCYPYLHLAQVIADRVRTSGSTFVFSMYSAPALAAAHAVTGVPKGIFYGNLDHAPQAAQLEDRALFGLTRLSLAERLRRRWRLGAQRRFFFELMRGYDFVWNSSARDATILRSSGVPQARYMQNMWPLPPAVDYAAERRTREQIAPFKICASIGGLQGTANTYGLEFLGRTLAPLLTERLPFPFELHVFGARQPTKAVAGVLTHPLIRVRGFVEDIDREILESPVFLVCNNVGRYKAQHTRFLHAWSLSACIIAHADNRLTMPELEHDQNVLLAGDAAEFAREIERAAGDRSLRERLAQGGRETFLRQFSPPVVMKKLLSEMASVGASRP